MNRRDFIKRMLAAGVAAGTIDPFYEVGKKLISIPSGKIFTNDPFTIDAFGNITVSQHSEKTTVLELHRWLQDMSDRVCTGEGHLDITSPNPSMRVTDNIIELQTGYYVKNPEYLRGGSLTQKDEVWSNIAAIYDPKGMIA